tara:strand:- start:443 stop:832 length:390 start_codon:yes stop_codon:yes gene_type:complete
MTNLNRILLVEDDPDIQQVAQMSLEAVGGFSVLACSRGAHAVEQAPEFAPDLILLDVMMPEMDGPTTLGKLRELEVTAKTTVVFMTAKVQATDRERYLSLGAVDVIAKPFDPMTLSDRLREIWAALPSA